MTMPGKVLITGASGLLGRSLLKCFKDKEWRVQGLAYTRASENLKKVDLTDVSQLEAAFGAFLPDVVVHAAAERRPDVVEKNQSEVEKLNVGVTKSLAEICKGHSKRLIYISTDYVFDGKDAPYAPGSPTNPINSYGVTKRDGEKEVLQYPDFSILRVPILYGPVETLGESAVTVLFKSVKQPDKKAEMNAFQRRYPTHVADVAQVCEQLAEKHLTAPGAGGIWHFSGTEVHTKYSMASVMADCFGLDKAHLVPTQDTGGVTRPFDCHLDSSCTMASFNVSVTPFSEGIKQVLQTLL